ncbi:MFS transporter [Micromonospora sp. NPDC049101]|uniref:MFS transporter n=1 Tax=Micromonospora sp. NPDC049101 TaxID=3155032 RepID=UPI0033E0BD90
MTASAAVNGPTAAAPEPRDRWGAVVACGLAVFITAVDLNVVGVALPTLGRQFDASPSAMQWVILAYALPMVAFILPAGRWGDGVDKRKAFVLAVAGFGLASILVATSRSLEMMVAARVVQALFGALISALVLATIAISVRPATMGRAMGVAASLGPLGGAIGPAGGGLLIDWAGWQWVFLINVPVCLVAGWLAWTAVPASDARLRPPRARWLVDAALLGIAGAALVLGLQEFGRLGAGLAVGAVLLVASVVAGALWLRRRDARPVVQLLRNRMVNRWMLGLFFAATLNGVLTFLTPFLLTRGIGASTSVTGFTILALSAGMVVFAPLGGTLTDRWGAHPMAVLGALLLLAGAVLMLPAGPTWGVGDVAWRLALVGAGTGLIASSTQTAVMTSTPPQLGATAGALSALVLNLGFAVGPAASALAWQLVDTDIARTTPAYAVGAVAAVLTVLALLAAPRRSASVPGPGAGPSAPEAAGA